MAVFACATVVAGAAELIGTGAGETLTGGPGADTLYGAGGDDKLSGGAGDDDLDGGPGADDLVGGAGTDAALYGGRTTPVTVTLDDVADDGVAGERDNVHRDIEDIYGGAAADTLTGNSGANLLDGAQGDDRLNGGKGRDLLYGGAGNDVIVSRDGHTDVVDCGPGTDTVDADAGDVVTNCEKHARLSRITSPVTYAFAASASKKTVTFTLLRVTETPKGGRVTVRCQAAGCPFTSRSFSPRSRVVSLSSSFAKRPLGSGTLEVRVLAADRVGKVVRFTWSGGHVPSKRTLCLPPGASTPKTRC